MKSLTLIAIIVIIFFLAAPVYADEHPPRPTGYADAASTKVASQHKAEPTHRPTVTPTLNPYPAPTVAPYPEPEVSCTFWYRLISWIME